MIDDNDKVYVIVDVPEPGAAATWPACPGNGRALLPLLEVKPFNGSVANQLGPVRSFNAVERLQVLAQTV